MSLHPLRLPLAALLCAASLIAGGCTEDPLSPAQPISVLATSIPPLDGDLYYELWLSYPIGKVAVQSAVTSPTNAEYVSVGRFRVKSDGSLVDLNGAAATFTIPAGRNAQLFIDGILTVQKPGVTETAPGPRMLSGTLIWSGGEGYADLELRGEDAFGSTITDDTKRYGSFVLDLPTSPTAGNYSQGIWFINKSKDTTDLTIRKGIGFPSLPFVTDNDHWTFETWLVHNLPSGPEYISLGRFVNPARPDSDGAGPGAGSNPAGAYPEPGEDFVTGTQRFLTDGSYGVILSLQPSDFAMSRPLVGLLVRDTIPVTAGRLDSIPMTKFSTTPKLEVTIAQ